MRNLLWIICLAACYPLYAWGQLYLFVSKQKEAEFYDLLNKYPDDWIYAHVLLMLGVVLLIPAFISFCHYFRNTKAYGLAQLSTVFTFITAFLLVGQFTIDLCLIALFKLPKETAYAVLNSIQNDPIIKPFFYDNSQLFSLLKYADFTLIAQALLGAAFILSKKIPRWAIILFFLTLLLTQFGILIGPYYGRIIKRASYALFSVSFLPVIRSLKKID